MKPRVRHWPHLHLSSHRLNGAQGLTTTQAAIALVSAPPNIPHAQTLPHMMDTFSEDDLGTERYSLEN